LATTAFADPTVGLDFKRPLYKRIEDAIAEILGAAPPPSSTREQIDNDISSALNHFRAQDQKEVQFLLECSLAKDILQALSNVKLAEGCIIFRS
jgi:hypothetical protein